MRGRTLNDSFVVLDEAQNTTPEQMKMFLTRLGFGTKMVVTGDITQVDLPGGRVAASGSSRASSTHIDDIHFARLTSDDVVRHTLVGKIVDAYTEYDEQHAGAALRARAGARVRQPRRAARDRRPARTARPTCRERGALMSIEINNESAIEVDEAALQRLAVYDLDELHVHPDAELAIVLVDEGAMEQLHVQWMDEPGPTDVLSFPMDELRPGTEDQPDPARAARRHRALPAGRRGAGADRRPLARSTSCMLLTTHGILHLLGFDHAEPEEEQEMFGIQRDLLVGFRDRRSGAADHAALAASSRPPSLLVAFGGLMAAVDCRDSA